MGKMACRQTQATPNTLAALNAGPKKHETSAHAMHMALLAGWALKWVRGLVDSNPPTPVSHPSPSVNHLPSGSHLLSVHCPRF